MLISSTAVPRVASCSPPRLVFQASGVEDTPLASITVNRAWVEAVLSAMNALETPDAWEAGTDYEAVETQLYTLYSIIVNSEDAVTLGTIATQDADNVAITGGSVKVSVLEVDTTAGVAPQFWRDGSEFQAHFASYSNTLTHGATIRLKRFRGSKAVPADVIQDDVLATIEAAGMVDGVETNTRGGIRWRAKQNWVTGANGTYCQILTTPNGSTTQAVAATFHDDKSFELEGAFNHDGTLIGLNGSTPVSKGTITGSRGGNAALASLLTYLASRGDIIDSTTV